MSKAIYFDMDGTVYDLYSIKNWLELLENEDESAYSIGNPLVDLDKLKEICLKLIACGYKIGIISWAAKGSSFEFYLKTQKAKWDWKEKNMPYVSEFYVQEYGTPKQYAINKKSSLMILVDDNEEVRAKWNTEKQRISIDARNNILEALEDILNSEY